MFIDPPPPPPSATMTPPAFVEVSTDVGLAGRIEGRLALTDLNGDGRPDLVLDRRFVFLNTPDPSAPRGFRFVAAPDSLPVMGETPAAA
ncbi:MAG: hypothetical protein JNK53_01990, partial [Phycisphaerae bacterium]|nr:hypothetical protein [Phycisphaerae bacterium]